MLVRMSFTITMALFGVGLICYFMFGCSAAAPLYVIDVQKLAGATPETAAQPLKEMVPCKLIHEDRWEDCNVHALPSEWDRYICLSQKMHLFSCRISQGCRRDNRNRGERFRLEAYYGKLSPSITQ
ncbi:hypothetical protein C6502_07330 [Candidatus Poribacteria bacterium]|nr:MAG: hypothetical protein C6502_07330 [Candidatus Poribacteria bacterium]